MSEGFTPDWKTERLDITGHGSDRLRAIADADAKARLYFGDGVAVTRKVNVSYVENEEYAMDGTVTGCRFAVDVSYFLPPSPRANQE